MVDETTNPTIGAASGTAPQPLINIGHIVYGCYALGFVIGLTWLVGVIIAYVKRDEAAGTWLASHFRWQIRTFWWGLLWGILFMPVAALLFITLVGIPLIYVLGIALVIWIIYRVVRGWLLLNDGKPVPGM
jgi:uncharacterized membrane protein